MIVLYIFIGLVILLLLAAAILPKSYNIEKTAIIKKPVAEVMNRIGDLNFYSQWNPWQQSDPTTKSTVSGSPKTPGHKYAWEGKKVGAGSLAIRDIDNKHIHFDLEFLKPWKSKAKDNWLFEEWGNAECKVTWQNSGNLPYPMGRLMGPIITKNLNQQFVTGLNNLKKMCEG
ncbi:MAG: SRPBCC family protein [Chitinophagales bacterium]